MKALLMTSPGKSRPRSLRMPLGRAAPYSAPGHSGPLGQASEPARGPFPGQVMRAGTAFLFLPIDDVTRDAEAGRVLTDYYIRRVGSHEVVAERLQLSRPTFYRRLQRGLALVVERLNDLGALADRRAS
jgi:hypothetical protein